MGASVGEAYVQPILETEAYNNKNRTTKNPDGTCISSEFKLQNGKNSPCICAKPGYVPSFMSGTEPRKIPICIKQCPTSIKGSDVGGKNIYTLNNEGNCVRTDPNNPGDPYVSPLEYTEEQLKNPNTIPFLYPKCKPGYWFDLGPNKCIDENVCKGASTDKEKAEQCCQQPVKGVGTVKNPYACPDNYKAPTWSEYYHWQ